jgi:hypothetical protein
MKTKQGQKGKDLRSPLAKARDAFFESPEGIACMDPGLLREPVMQHGPYLRNRMEIAFLAGVEAANRLALASPRKGRKI